MTPWTSGATEPWTPRATPSSPRSWTRRRSSRSSPDARRSNRSARRLPRQHPPAVARHGRPVPDRGPARGGRRASLRRAGRRGHRRLRLARWPGQLPPDRYHAKTTVDYDGQPPSGVRGPARFRFVASLAGSLIDQGLDALDTRLPGASRRDGQENARRDGHELLPATLRTGGARPARDHGPDLLVMAGGTVAMPLINEGISLPERVMGLRHAGLDRSTAKTGRCGSGPRRRSPSSWSSDDVPLLARSGPEHRELGGPQYRDGRREPVHAAARGRRRRRAPGAGCAGDPRGRPRRRGRLPLADFFTGFMTNALADDELLVEIRVPDPGRPDRLHQVRPQAREHAGRRDGRGPPRVDRRDGRRRPDRAGRSRSAPRSARTRPRGSSSARRSDRRPSRRPPRRPPTSTTRSRMPSPPTWYRRRMAGVFVARALERLASDVDRRER